MKKKLHSFKANYQSIFIFCFALLLNVGVINGQTEIATNGDFETGDDTGWLLFQNGGSAVLDNTIANGGTWSGKLETGGPSNPAFKQEAIGVGAVAAGDLVTISFDHIGSVVQPGAVFNVLLFGEGAAPGASFTHVFNPAPVLAATWTTFTGTFTIPAGIDVSGGVSFLIEAVCGGDAGCSVSANIDNVSVTIPDSGPIARVQVIHNSADAAASLVDVYLDGTLLIDDFAFRTASSFINAPAGTEISVAIAPSTSTSVGDAIATFPYTLTDGETYVLVAEGIVSASGYNPATAFDIAVYAMGQEAAATTGNTDLLVHHGATDAPTVDVNEVSGPAVLVDNISYGEFDANGYLELPTADYNINISTADGSTVVESYDAPLATLGLNDAAAVVVASGFLDPTVNSNGPAFGLWVALPSGGALVELPITGAATGNNVTVDVNASWVGYVVAFNTPADGGAYAADFGYPVADIKSTIGTDNITLQPNFALYNAADAFWANGVQGNKIVECTTFVEPGATFNGNDLTFSGTVDSNTLGSDALGNPYEAKFFIKALDPGAGFSDALNGTKIFDLPASGAFTVSATGAELASGLIVQYGFYIKGLNANPTEEATLGSIVVSAAALSITDLEEMTFKVYPNPTNNVWNVKTNNTTINSIQVFDMLGKQVLSLNPNSAEAQIDASSLNAGLYFARITSGSSINSIKLIKK